MPRLFQSIADGRESAILSEDHLRIGVLTLLENQLHATWDSLASATSGYVPLSTQLDAIRELGEYLVFAADAVNSPESSTYKRLVERTGAFAEQWRYLRLHTARVEPRPTQLAQPEFLNRLEPEKQDLIRLALESGALQEVDEPRFMLRSGYRSFYFFNGASLTHHANTAGPLSEYVAPELDRLLKKAGKPRDETRLAFALRAVGETSGIASMAGALAEKTHVSCITLPPAVPKGFVDRVDGTAPKDAKYLILVDDVSVTGGSAVSHVQRYEGSIKGSIIAYYVLLDRRVGPRPEPLTRVSFSSALAKEDLIRARVWTPELLRIDAASELLPSLDLTCDYLYEIGLYQGHPTGEYDRLRQSFNAIAESMFPEQARVPETLVNYVTNMQLLLLTDMATITRPDS